MLLNFLFYGLPDDHKYLCAVKSIMLSMLIFKTNILEMANLRRLQHIMKKTHIH